MNKRLKIGGGKADGSCFIARAVTGYSDDTGKDLRPELASSPFLSSEKAIQNC